MDDKSSPDSHNEKVMIRALEPEMADPTGSSPVRCSEHCPEPSEGEYLHPPTSVPSNQR